MSDPWKEYKKGVKYLKKHGLWLMIKLPHGGKFEWIQAKPGFAIKDKAKETLPRPVTLKASGGKTYKISKEFMDKFQLVTELDLQRIIRNTSILLTNFSGPKDNDIIENHLKRLQNWKADNAKQKIQDFMIALVMLESLHGSKEPLPNNHYAEATTVIGYLFKLW